MCNRADNDCPVVITGDAGLGKSTLMIWWMRYHAYYSRKMFRTPIRFDLDRSLYYMRSPNAKSDLLSLSKDERGFDEGYFSGMNKESMSREVVALEKAVNAVRDGLNLLIWNFSLMQRATRPLIERALIWVHKPNRETGNLYIRSREFVTNDVWSTKDLLNARPYEIDYFLKYNPNRITTFECYKLPPKLDSGYRLRKKNAHAVEADRQRSETATREIDLTLIKEIEKDAANERIDFSRFKQYLMVKYSLNKKEAGAYEKQYYLHTSRNKIAGQFGLRARRVDAIEETEE